MDETYGAGHQRVSGRRAPAVVVSATVPSGQVTSDAADIRGMGLCALEIPALSGFASAPTITLEVSDVPAGSFKNLLKSDATGETNVWSIMTASLSGNASVPVYDLAPFGAAKVCVSLSGAAANTFRFIGKE